VSDRLELELDVQAYSSIGAYSMIATQQPTLIYTDSGSNRLPSVMSQPFAGLTSASDSVVNVSAGGQVRLLRGRDLRLHAGIAGNGSPVGPEDAVFNRVDLLTWTLGVSGSLGRVQFAAGFNHQSGTTDDVTLHNLLNGQAVRSGLDVGMTGFIYSLAYQF
jgi:hypothetical protein